MEENMLSKSSNKIMTVIKSNTVQNIIAIYMVIHLIFEAKRIFLRILTYDSSLPGSEYYFQAIVLSIFSFVGYFCILSFVSLYRLNKAKSFDILFFYFSKRLYSEEIFQMYFEPLIADWRIERSRIVSQQSPWISKKESEKLEWKLFKIDISYTFSTFLVFFQQSWLGKIFEIIKR